VRVNNKICGLWIHYRTLLLFVFDRRGAEAQSKATCDMFSHQCFMVISDDFFSAPLRLCGHSKKVCGTEVYGRTMTAPTF
jgi:hypothetical protein